METESTCHRKSHNRRRVSIALGLCCDSGDPSSTFGNQLGQRKSKVASSAVLMLHPVESSQKQPCVFVAHRLALDIAPSPSQIALGTKGAAQKVVIVGPREMFGERSLRLARDEKYQRQEPDAGETEAILRARDAGAAEARPRSTHGPRCAFSGTARGVPPRTICLSRASKNQIFPKNERSGAIPSVGADHSVPAGPRTATSHGTGRATRRERTPPRRWRGAYGCVCPALSLREWATMVTTARKPTPV